MNGTDVVRFVASGVAGVVAVLYLLTGFVVITVVQNRSEAGAHWCSSPGCCSLCSRCCWRSPPPVRCWSPEWPLQVVVLVMYLVVSTERIPAFEAWELGIKALQAGLLAAFVVMLVR